MNTHDAGATIAFLDIDGVVLPVGAVKDLDVTAIVKDPWAHLEVLASAVPEKAVANLKTLAAELPAQFVLISTWRKVFPVEFNKAFMERLGLFPLFHEDWFASFRFSSAKVHDMLDWLGDHKGIRQTNTLVIDDDNLMIGSLFQCGIHQHIPKSHIGFADADLEAVLARFGRLAPPASAAAG